MKNKSFKMLSRRKLMVAENLANFKIKRAN